MAEAGRTVRVVEAGEALPAARVLVALHAGKSAGAVERFRASCPGRPVVVVLTGSDLHVDLEAGGGARDAVLRTMEDADQLVVAQEGSVPAVPEAMRPKLEVVWKSVDVEVGRWAGSGRPGVVRGVVLAHLRVLKDPFRAADAVRGLGRDSRLVVEHYGAATDSETVSRAVWESATNPRWRWCGEVPRREALRLLARCDLHLNTALMEGGANSVCEAIVTGTPVIATRIPGNVGMLGRGYSGYFEPRDTLGLRRLLERCESDPGFLRGLADEVAERAPLFTRDSERAGWLRVLGRLDCAF